MLNGRTSIKRLFTIGDVVALELGESDLPKLQTFFASNPQYFVVVHGEPPRFDEARREFFDRPPVEMPYDQVHILGFVDAEGSLIAMTSVISNLLATHVWHIGLFVVATSLHGTGVAHALYAGLEQWLGEQGAVWIRLGAVSGYAQAERFWSKQGYVEVRCRHDVPLGKLVHSVRVLIKPMSDRSLVEYLDAVPRDRPDVTLP
jgi:GNAT superfamily N-acetyltransferase